MIDRYNGGPDRPRDAAADMYADQDSLRDQNLNADPDSPSADADNPPESKQGPDSTLKFVRVNKDDTDSPLLGGKRMVFMVVDPNADPAQSIVEPGTGRRLRLSTEEERDRWAASDNRDSEPFQKEAPKAPASAATDNMGGDAGRSADTSGGAADAAGDTGGKKEKSPEEMTGKEKAQKYKELEAQLEARYPGKSVEVAPGRRVWVDDDGKAWRATLTGEEEWKVGELRNWGTKDKPIYKKWTGKDSGVVDASKDEVDAWKKSRKKGAEGAAGGAAVVEDEPYEEPRVPPSGDFEGNTDIEDPNVVKAPKFRSSLGPQEGLVPEFLEKQLKEMQVHDDPRLQGEPPSMQEILETPKGSDLFARLITNIGGEKGADILYKFKEHPEELTHKDLQDLRSYRIEYRRRTLLLAEAQANITDADIDYMVHNDQNFGDAFEMARTSLKDPANIRQKIRTSMENHFMYLDMEQVERLSRAVQRNMDIRRSDDYKRLAENVQRKLDDPRYNIETLDPSRRDVLNQGIVTKVLSWGRRSTENSQRILYAREGNVRDIMSVLAPTVANDVELKRALAHEAITSKDVYLRAGDMVMDQRKYAQEWAKAERPIENVDAVATRIKSPEFRQGVEDITGMKWNDLTKLEREQASYKLLQTQGILPRPVYRGFLSLVFSALASRLLGELRTRLKSKDAFGDNT